MMIYNAHLGWREVVTEAMSPEEAKKYIRQPETIGYGDNDYVEKKEKDTEKEKDNRPPYVSHKKVMEDKRHLEWVVLWHIPDGKPPIVRAAFSSYHDAYEYERNLVKTHKFPISIQSNRVY